jgi:hypothetical protein
MSHPVSGGGPRAGSAALVAALFTAGICTLCAAAPAPGGTAPPGSAAPPPLEAAAAAEPSGTIAQPAAPAAAGRAAGASGNAVGPGEAAEDIRDIRGPKFIWPAWLVPALLAGTVLLAWLGRAAWRWLHRSRPRVLLPFEIALQRLENLRALLQPERAREFSTEVSGIIRDYIEQRFDVIATHQTTEEFLYDLLKSSNAALAKHRALLSAFLHQCDLVKFAGMSLTLQSMESLHTGARTFVLETAKPEDPTATEIRAGAGAGGRGPAPRATTGKEAHDSLPST